MMKLLGVIDVLREFMGKAPERPRSWYELIPWWELRRIPYNVIVGVAGLISLLILFVVDSLPPQLPPAQQDFDYLFAPVAAAIAANIIYSVGCCAEIALRLIPRREHPGFGPAALRLGLAFSAVVVLSPAVINGGFWLSRLATTMAR